MPKDPKLINAVSNRYNKLESKLECLIKATKDKEETPDHDIRICDQTLWSASEMINYRNEYYINNPITAENSSSP